MQNPISKITKTKKGWESGTCLESMGSTVQIPELPIIIIIIIIDCCIKESSDGHININR
jgi:hypothetical protein